MSYLIVTVISIVFGVAVAISTTSSSSPGRAPDSVGQIGLAAPAPIAGTGIPAIVVIGGYVWMKWRRRNLRNVGKE